MLNSSKTLALCCGLVCAQGAAAAHAQSLPAGSASSSQTGATTSAGAAASFDRNMLSGGGAQIDDLQRFERDNPVAPGTYSVDVYVNQAPLGRRDVRFRNVPDHAGATACIDKALLLRLGLRAAPAPVTAAEATPAGPCYDLAARYPGTTLRFDQANLRLDVSIPQAWFANSARGYVDPRDWDAGVPAGLLGYQFSSFHANAAGGDQRSDFLGLDAGLNIGGWHLRHDSTLIRQSGRGGSQTQWRTLGTYVQRDLSAWRAQATVGDFFTSGQWFDSIGMRGVRLATDDRMLPDSQRGYAPTIRGTAAGNAVVRVSQNGLTIYQTTVAPGPFVIDDLFPTGYGGDLDVTVTEADGRVRSFRVPYASIAQLLRPGVSRFEVAAGRWHEPGIPEGPAVAQATLQRGFSNVLTGYAGILGAPDYHAALLGAALNTAFGALALDVTHARSRVSGYGAQSGQAVEISFGKVLPRTSTAINLAAYRHASRGYLGVRDFMQARARARLGLPQFSTGGPPVPSIPGVLPPDFTTPVDPFAPGTIGDASADRERNRVDVNVSQQLPALGGSLYATLSRRDYWNRPGVDNEYQVGYSGAVGIVSYSLSAARLRDPMGRQSDQYFASFSIPLGSAVRAPNLTASSTVDGRGQNLSQVLVTGSAGRDNAISYGLTAAHANGTAGASGSADSASVNATWRSSVGQFNASYSRGGTYTQYAYAANGVIVAHPGGILLGQPAGDTLAIVFAKDAAGARVANTSGVRINRAGYALVPYLIPYSRNVVELDPGGLPLDVQLDATSMVVAPYAGAVVQVTFPTRKARSIIIQARLDDGRNVPFGAEVTDAAQHVLGTVGQGGRALLGGIGDAGRLEIHWSADGADHACAFDYRAGPTVSTILAEHKVTCAAVPQAAPQPGSSP